MADKNLAQELSASRFGVSKLRPGTLQVTVSEKVNVDELSQIIARISDLNGCRTCGLGGIDVLFRGIDPIAERFADIAAVRDVTMVR